MKKEMKKEDTLAIIVPCYNEEEIIESSIEELLKVLNNLKDSGKISQDSYISFIDDGCTDSTWEKLVQASMKDKNIHAIKLLYNSGQQGAMYCGMVENDADIYITIDCDLQDDINAIPEMVEKYLLNQVDVVYGVRNDRNTDTFFKRVAAEIYYKLNSTILSISGKKGGLYNHSEFRLVSKNVVKFLKQIKEHNLYLRGLIYNKNFKHEIVYFCRKKRKAGFSKYNIFSLTELAINGIVNQTILPLRLIFAFALIFLIISIFTKSSLFFSSSINLFAIGLLGEYLGKVFVEVQNRPKYTIQDKINY